MKLFATLVITSTTILFGVTIPVVQAQTPAYRLIERDTAASSRIQVQVTPGRATPISFTQTDEAIAYILVADPSRLVYTTDTDLKSGRATTIFLRAIQPLKFPGATTTAITNLLVQTVDKTGQKRLYNFDIVPVRRNTGYIGIQIANAIVVPLRGSKLRVADAPEDVAVPLWGSKLRSRFASPTGEGIASGTARRRKAASESSAIAGQQTLLIDKNRRARVDDIETGLRIAINRGYTNTSDPVVPKVQQVLDLLRNSRITIPEAAKSVGVPVEVISELGRIALNDRLLKLGQQR
ncbi:hypothetical protein VF14_00070 [Nostoc linckia z18]|uniref:Uncharacterized protein n=2 Tax=Nostoc linckia TaxID=92942 RepID=A0A9Q6EN66_NOSLI|nr:hypothetical protein [Nostoc linckia]PHK43084.1 hypothetical protein VF12_00070 [Nostoc linckia z15]PHK48353.1 hypothetical protein VF13_00065 [Nostoc linckia z16]PHJ67262.1 hypothetical protein VF02_05730 [Nostoc linckia z1]PHJ71063.1 hypothetical protein VF05_08085 [Nostoc linckia z3]PHJ76502.1 hypothetical protein VF03_06940 [Nostoc linckia z2]